jgi:hypothetical protein
MHLDIVDILFVLHREAEGDFEEGELGIRFYPMKRSWKDDNTGRTDSKSLTQAINYQVQKHLFVLANNAMTLLALW